MRPIPPEPATAALLALLATGCTVEHQPAAVAGTAGAKPGIVVGGMTSAVEYRPLTVEEFAIPGTRSAVEQCERAGRQHCREQEVPRDRRRTFTKEVDPKAVALFQVGGLRPGMTLDGACRFTDPSGSTAATLHATAPSGSPRRTCRPSDAGLLLHDGPELRGARRRLDGGVRHQRRASVGAAFRGRRGFQLRGSLKVA